MNLRCIYCQTPFTLSRTEMLSAIVTMNEKSQNHYDAHCPRCRRANSISRQRMELFYPNWKEEAAKMKSAAEAAPAKTEIAPASAMLPTEPLVKAKVSTAKKPAAKKTATTADKKPAAKKTTATKTTAEKKTATTADKKPATKKTTTPKKK